MTSSKEFRGFGKRKLRAQNEEKISVRKALKQIQNLAKGKKYEGIFQEIKAIASGNEEVQESPKADNLTNGESGDESGDGKPAGHESSPSGMGSGNWDSDVGSLISSDKPICIADDGHIKEWVEGSAVDPEIVALNVKSLSGNTPYDYLCYSDKLPRLNTGALNRFWMQRYAHTYAGGWWCSGVDVLTGGDSQWGTFKPNEKYIDGEGKPIKYEHPPKVPTELFALKVPPRLWQLVARRYDLSLPENYQTLPHSAFWKWVIDHPKIPLIITEGPKKVAAVLSCGYVCVALPGIWSGVRQPKDEDGNPDGMASLIPQLQVFAQTGRRIYFAFDQDTKRTTARSVSKAIAKTAKLFLTQKCEVKVISWNSAIGKGIDDVLVALGREKFDELYRNALTFDEWSSLQLRRLTYSPNLVINRRYIGEIEIPASAQLIGVRGPKGCGKTELLRWLTEPQIKSGERKTLLISHRIQLALQTSSRLGIPFVTQLKDTEQGSLFGYALCIDSLHRESQARFIPQEWWGATIVLDEIQQILWHLLSSSTCTSKRVAIIKTLQELLQIVIKSGGRIIILDADLNDISIDFIEGLLGFSPERFILVNEYKFQNPWTIYKFGGKNPAGMIAELEVHLQNGKKALLCLSAQKPKSRWGTQVQEEYFRRKYPHLKILRIDSESVANPEHEAFGCTENLNNIVVKYDLVISSPTIETGVSIDVEHFDGVWQVGQGLQTADGTRQNLARNRPPVPRYVWIKSQGINFQGNKTTTPSALIASQKRVDKANRGKLLESGLQEMPDGNFSPICLETWAKLAAVINLGMWKYEETILKDLEEEGHHIINWNDRENDEVEGSSLSPDTVEKQVDAVRDEFYLKYRQDVSASSTLTDTEFEKLNRQQQRKTDELLQLIKGQVERKYLVECSPELIEKDDNKWGSKLRLHYFWKDGREYLQFKDAQFMEKAIAHGQGDYFMIDSNRSLMQMKVGLLDYLGIARLYEGAGFHNGHPAVVDILEKVRVAARHVQTVAGIDLSKVAKDEKRSIEGLQMILNLLGHKMTCYARKGKRGAEIRYYSTPAPEFERDEETKKLILGEDGLPIPKVDGREEVFAAWLERDAELKRKAEEQKALALAEDERIKAELTRRKAEEEARALEAQQQHIGFTAESLAEVLSTIDAREQYEDLLTCNDKMLVEAAWALVDQEVRDRINAFYKPQAINEVTPNHPQVLDTVSELELVDEELKTSSHLSELEELPAVELWIRRLNRALLITKESAKRVYSLLPHQILHEVWGRLSYGVQSQYVELFAT